MMFRVALSLSLKTLQGHLTDNKQSRVDSDVVCQHSVLSVYHFHLCYTTSSHWSENRPRLKSRRNHR